MDYTISNFTIKAALEVKSFTFETIHGLPCNVIVKTSYYPQPIKLFALCPNGQKWQKWDQQDLDIYSQIGEMLRNQ